MLFPAVIPQNNRYIPLFLSKKPAAKRDRTSKLYKAVYAVNVWLYFMELKKMKMKSLSAIALLALSLGTLAGCASNQSIKTTDGRTIVTDGKPQIDSDTGLVSYRDAQTGKTEQINRNEISNMSELDN